MKLLICLFVTFALAAARPEEDNHYDSKYDNFNVQEVIENERLMKSYAHCFIGDGKCTPDGQKISKWIPEGSKTGCEKCTPKQKVLVAKFIKGMQTTCPEEWAILNNKMDPEGKYQEDLQKFVDEYSK